MHANDVIRLINLFTAESILIWIDGGWGVDALIGKQTRTHRDLDLVVLLNDAEKIQALLVREGFKISQDQRPTRFVMHDEFGRQLDFHTVIPDAEGGGNQHLPDGRVYRYNPQGFTGIGIINGISVPCLTAEVQADCHYGYEPDEDDRHDMKLLHEVYGIALKEPYKT